MRTVTSSWLVASMLVGLVGCSDRSRPPPGAQAPEAAAPVRSARPARAEEPRWTALRDRLVDQLERRGIRDARVLAAMRAVPRHELVPDPDDDAYGDHPLPIGHDQTISQPYIVAFMTEAAAIAPGARVLEIGTGSGYQAAVLAELGADVYSIEIVEPLGKRAAASLRALGYDVHLRIGDGYRGWPEAAPFDAVIVTAAPPEVPQPLKDQLRVGGRLVVPVGEQGAVQELRVITRTADGFDERTLLPVSFVPMTGEASR